MHMVSLLNSIASFHADSVCSSRQTVPVVNHQFAMLNDVWDEREMETKAGKKEFLTSGRYRTAEKSVSEVVFLLFHFGLCNITIMFV